MSTPRNQSVIKAFAMLKSFAHQDEWLTSSELSRRADIPKASGYRLIQTLEELGAVTRGSKGRYRPGMLLVELSQKVQIGELVHEAGRPIVTALAKRLDLTLHIGLLEAGMVTYVTKVSTRRSFVTHTRPGAQLEAYCSGLGKVLLAALPEEELDSFMMEGDLIPLTPFTITNIAKLREQLRDVARKGFAVDDREIRVDMRCVAVPIRDAHGKTIAAVSATDSVDKMTPERVDELRLLLQAAAAKIGAKVVPADRPLKFRSRAGRSIAAGNDDVAYSAAL
jgi:IclR family acetate operon transcriptional repressor